MQAAEMKTTEDTNEAIAALITSSDPGSRVHGRLLATTVNDSLYEFLRSEMRREDFHEAGLYAGISVYFASVIASIHASGHEPHPPCHLGKTIAEQLGEVIDAGIEAIYQKRS